jgi:CRISPR-associated protein Csb1
MVFFLNDLVSGARHASAIRRRRRLQPAGGPGDKLFPPTYPPDVKNAPPVHVFERRRLPAHGGEVWCVLLDSVQSQANRLEEALLRAAEEGRIELPRILVDFAAAGLNSIGAISSLEAPHRVFDAILRDSLLGEQKFLAESALGRRLREATAKDASAILEASPSALLFGVWNSTGEGGGLGAKFPRAIVSEIIGVDVPVEEVVADRRTGEIAVRTAGRRTGSRMDPLGVSSSVTIYRSKTDKKEWTPNEDEAAKDQKGAPILFKRNEKSKTEAGKPAQINHGNIRPEIKPLGITCAYAEQTVVITLAGLRRLRFGGDAAREEAARALIAALGLVALTELDRQGYALRSRCDLVCDGPAPFELVACDGTTTPFDLSAEEAAALYAEALARAREVGFTLAPEPVRLTPQPKLIKIVQESMERALADEGGEADEADDS